MAWQTERQASFVGTWHHPGLVPPAYFILCEQAMGTLSMRVTLVWSFMPSYPHMFLNKDSVEVRKSRPQPLNICFLVFFWPAGGFARQSRSPSTIAWHFVQGQFGFAGQSHNFFSVLIRSVEEFAGRNRICQLLLTTVWSKDTSGLHYGKSTVCCSASGGNQVRESSLGGNQVTVADADQERLISCTNLSGHQVN